MYVQLDTTKLAINHSLILAGKCRFYLSDLRDTNTLTTPYDKTSVSLMQIHCTLLNGFCR